MLSILIPTYNHNVYELTHQVHSQAEQLSIPYEILVIDDHSTLFLSENEKIKELSNVQFTILEKNIGRSGVRAMLAENAQFDTLLFLDADVLPGSKMFLANYISQSKITSTDVIFGGVAYVKDAPPIENRLRWQYGKNREVKSAADREQNPYFVISQNLFISKDCFQKINTSLENFYGDDLILSQQLKKGQIKVCHIDNPVFHLGLETSKDYLTKALSAVETIVMLEDKGQLDKDLTKLQRSYLHLKKWNCTGLFRAIIGLFTQLMEKNFISERPNLFWFDLYRLHYYIQLKNKKSV